jgi:hypothetical protein
VKWHGHDDVRLAYKIASCTAEPARKAWRKIEAVGVLKCKNRALARIIVPHHGTGSVEGRRFPQTGRAARSFEQRRIEWQTTGCALRSIDERDFVPALCAKVSRLANLTPALKTQGRKQKVERAPANDGKPLRNPRRLAAKLKS